MSGISISELELRFGDLRVLSDLDLHVPSSSVTAVLGKSGCGKTTLLRAIAGLARPGTGRIRLGDLTVFGPGCWVGPERRNIGLVPQEGALFPHLDVAGNVGFGIRGPRQWRAARVAELLELVGMAGTGSLRPDQLSGGMQQRVAVARALSRRPSVVLLDEPFSALDTGLRETVRTDVLRAIADDGATALLVTHDQDEALGAADVVAVMRDGHIVQAGAPELIYYEPADRGVAAFVGESIELPATIAAATPDPTADCALGRVPVRPARAPTAGEQGLIVLRPEELGLGADRTGVAVTVESIRYHGHDCLIRTVTGAGETITVRHLGLPRVRPGEGTWVHVIGRPRFFSRSADGPDRT